MRRVRGLTVAIAAALLISALDTTAEAQFWPSAQATLAKALTSSVVEERRDAAKRLHALPPSVCRRLVAQALDDPDVQVRQIAGQLALARRYRELAVRVQAWLSDAEPTIRELGARMFALADVGDEQVALLARLLSDPVVNVRKAAAQVLGQADGSAAAVLLNHLGDSNDDVRLTVIEALGALASPVATLPLLSKMQDPNPAIRRACVEALGEIEDNALVNALNLALTDVDTDVRSAAVGVVAKRKVFDAVDGLRERMNADRDVDVRVGALRALAQLGAQADCPPAVRAVIATTLIDALGHVKQELRDEALSTLRRIPAFALPELRSCLAEVYSSAAVASNRTFGCALALAQDDSQQAHASAENSLNGPNLGSFELVLAAWRGGQLSDSELLGVLATGRYVAGLPVVLDLLTSPTAQVRAQAFDTAYELLDPTSADGRAVEPLGAFLTNTSSVDELASAIALLGHTGSRRAVSHLLAFAQPQAPLVLRTAAFHALGEIKGAKVPLVLVADALTADSVRLRQAAASSLREGEWVGLGEPLVKLLSRATYDEIENVATALWGVTPTLTEPRLVDILASEVEKALPVHQDALIEAFGRVPWAAAKRHWQKWINSANCRTLAKIAETLGASVEAKDLITPLLDSKCEAAVLNAAWSLRHFPLDEKLLFALTNLTRSENQRIAGNAVAAIAFPRRLTPPTASDEPKGVHSAPNGQVLSVLCAGIELGRWGAPALVNALTGLRYHAHRCPTDGVHERELVYHPARHVRQRAASLLLTVPANSAAGVSLDRRMLRRCAQQDIDGDVAATCLQAKKHDPIKVEHWATIVVVSGAGQAALPNAPYVLERKDSWFRAGIADRRGALLEKIHSADDVTLLRY